MHLTAVPHTLNRDTPAAAFAIPADGWMQLVPLGRINVPLELERAGQIEEVQIVQEVIASTVNRLAAAFGAQAAKPNFPGLLVDFDHFSNDTEKSSRAAAWIEEVAARADGLWGRVRFSASGKAAVEGGDYRLFSPVLGFTPRAYQAGEVVEPSVLLRGALTNDPRYKGMLPVSNRQTPFPSPTPMNNPKLIQLLVALGATIAADAAPEAVDAALTSAITMAEKNKTDLATTTSRLTTLEGQLVESDLDKAGLQGAARDAAKIVLTKNRAEGLALITALGKPDSGYAVTHNRNKATPPNADKGTAGEAATAEVRAAKISCLAREIRAAKPGTSLNDAYATASAEIDAATTK